jgi:hypothetical protein
MSTSASPAATPEPAPCAAAREPTPTPAPNGCAADSLAIGGGPLSKEGADVICESASRSWRDQPVHVRQGNIASPRDDSAIHRIAAKAIDN